MEQTSNRQRAGNAHNGHQVTELAAKPVNGGGVSIDLAMDANGGADMGDEEFVRY